MHIGEKSIGSIFHSSDTRHLHKEEEIISIFDSF
jgi:hypothetical protein